MKRKDRPLYKRTLGTICSFALVGACGYAFFTGLNLLTTLLIGMAILSIIAPVVIAGGSLVEILVGIVEAFIDGLMGVIDVIASFFNF